MLDTVTGAISELDTKEVVGVKFGSEYDEMVFWIEGNFGCDCNRASIFDCEVPCGSGRFIITSPETWAEFDRETNLTTLKGVA